MHLKLWRAVSVVGLAVCFGIVVAAADNPSFYLKSGDTVVFYGDSITDQRLYTMFTELYAVTRYPGLAVKFVHSGWGGDRVSGGGGGPIDTRLDRDVLAYNPSVVTIMLGMNDGNYVKHMPADDQTFYNGYAHIVDKLHQALPSVRITAIEPSPFDDVTRPFTLQPDGYNTVLINYGNWIRHYATQAHLNVADLNAPVVAMLKRANTEDPVTAQKIVPDRVHPSAAGHLIMAEQLLKSWNARAIVSTVSIDAGKGEVTRSEYATISDLHPGAPFVWTETDDALPLPFVALLATDREHTMALAIKDSDITEALNQELLIVTHLDAGRYNLTIDGELVGTWTAAELAHGINLAVLDTPLARQAAEVRDLTVRHIDIHQARWRTFDVPVRKIEIAHLDDTLRSMDAVEAEVVRRQHAAAEPKPHVFQLSAAK